MPQPNNSPRGVPRAKPCTRGLGTQIGELRDRLGGLPSPVEAEGIWRGIWLEEARHSTAIKGNTLVLKQVEALLAEGRAVGNKELSEYLEVRGYADAADWVYGHAIAPDEGAGHGLITVTELRHVHQLAMTPGWDVSPHPGPPTARDRDPETLACAHARFEQIHPFLDGNGRAGRLVLNLILVRLGFPPATIYKGDRARCLNALRRADQSDCGPLGEFLARAILDSLYKFVVPAVAGPARLVPLPALVTTDIFANALRVAAIRGRLKGRQGIGRHLARLARLGRGVRRQPP